jgi:hypothetical protein
MTSQNFLSYWNPQTALSNLEEGGLLEHSASEQYQRIRPGDTVWIVTVYSGSLHLVGRIIVGYVENQSNAAEMLGTSDLWPASHHIIAAKDTAQPIKDIPIDHLADRLRFESASGRDRLVMTNGRVRPQQLQTMRVLNTDSASLLENALHTETRSRRNGDNEKSSRQTPSHHSNSPLKKRDELRQLTARDENKSFVDRQSMLETLRRLQNATSEDLLKPEYRDGDSSEVPYDGFCYVLSECMFHLFPGEFMPYRINWGDGGSHWFLRFSDGSIFEPNMKNAAEIPGLHYEDARRRRGFLRKQPSKRARTLLKRAGLSLPSKQE